MPWIQDHLLAVLELLPKTIEPGDEVPNFHRLTLRIALIERQHFALSLQDWIESNSQWLTSQGLSIQAALTPAHDGSQALTFYESHEEEQTHKWPDPSERNTQVDRLVDLLDLHSTPVNRSFVQYAVEDLNHIRWDPERYRQILAFKLTDAVPDSYTWLGRHNAARQAKFLNAGTRASRSQPKKPRL